MGEYVSRDGASVIWLAIACLAAIGALNAWATRQIVNRVNALQTELEAVAICPHLETVNHGTFGAPDVRCLRCGARVDDYDA